MTLPYERTYAVHNTREFLRSLLDPKQTPKVPKKIRQQAYRCLKHYPTDLDLERAADDKIFGKCALYDPSDWSRMGPGDCE